MYRTALKNFATISALASFAVAAPKNKAAAQKYFLGSVLSGGGPDPASGNTAQDWLNLVNEFQSHALQTRFKIPLLKRGHGWAWK